MKVVIDTNILISALLKDSLTRKLLIEPSFDFYYPEIALEEVQKYKLLIIKKTGMTDNEYCSLLKLLFQNIILLSNKVLFDRLEEAKEIMQKIDPDDVIFVAGALSLKGIIWSNDKHFQQQKKVRTLTTTRIMELSSNL